MATRRASYPVVTSSSEVQIISRNRRALRRHMNEELKDTWEITAADERKRCHKMRTC